MINSYLSSKVREEPTFYLCKKVSQGPQEEWTWPDDDLSEEVETAQAVDEQYRPSPDLVSNLTSLNYSSALTTGTGQY